MSSIAKKLKVLIVEDEPSMAKAIQRILNNAGFETYIANTGFEAGVCLYRIVPDILTLDLKMPEMNGEDVLKIVSELEHVRHIKILLVSAKSSEELEALLEKGADDILEKPFEKEVLVEKVKKLAGL